MTTNLNILMYFITGGSKQIQYTLPISFFLEIYIQFNEYIYPTMEENWENFQNIWQHMLTLYRL